MSNKNKFGCFWDIFAVTFILAILSAIAIPNFIGIKETPEHLLAMRTIKNFIISCSIKKNTLENELNKISENLESPRFRSLEEFIDNKARNNKYSFFSSNSPHKLQIILIMRKEKISLTEARQKYNSYHMDWRKEYWKIMESLELNNSEHLKYKRLFKKYQNYRDSLPKKLESSKTELVNLSASEISQEINKEAYQFFPKDFVCSGSDDGWVIMSALKKNQLPSFSYNIFTNEKKCSHEGPTEKYLGCSNKINGTW